MIPTDLASSEISSQPAVKNASRIPQFENKLIEELYNYNFRLPHDILRQILSLPEDSLVDDLKMVLDDSVARFGYFQEATRENYIHTQFLAHGIFILAELRRTDCLPKIFEVLKSGDEFTDFYLDDMKTELLWIALFKLCVHDVSPLFMLLKEPAIDTFCRCAANQALEQLYYHKENLRDEIVHAYAKLADEFVASKEDELIADTFVIADAACTMTYISGEKLRESIKLLYEQNLVDLDCAGEFEELMNDQAFNFKSAVPTIYEMYEKVINTWFSYDDRFEDDFPDFDDEYETDDELHQPFVRSTPKIGRNDPCPCGSGKKYKKCCMVSDNA